MSEHRSLLELSLAPMTIALVIGSTLGAAAQSAQNSQSLQDMQNMPGMSHSAQGDKAKGKSSKTSQAAAGGGSLQVSDVVVDVDPGEKKMMEVMMRKPRQGDVVTGKQAQEQQFTTLNDFAYWVPAFNPNLETPHYARMTIRALGIASSGTGAGTQNETGFVVDDVPWIQPEFMIGNWEHISSFEIGYGPAGTAGGKNSDVGAIYITTPLPAFARKTQFSQTVGNYGHILEDIDTTGPINDNLAYRVTGYYERANGWIHNNSGPNYGNIARGGVRAQLYYTGDKFDDRLIFNFNRSDENSFYGMGEGTGSITAPIGNSFLVYGNGVKAPTYFSTFAKRIGKPILTTSPYNLYVPQAGDDPAEDITLTNELNYRIGANTLTSIGAIGYGFTQQTDCTDNQNVFIGTISCGMDTYVLQASHELRFSSQKGEKLEWTVGLYTLYEDAWNDMHHWEFGPYAAQWYSQPAAVNGTGVTLRTTARDGQVAPYAQATYHFTDQFSLTAGIRNNFDARYGAVTYLPHYGSTSVYSPAKQNAAILAAYAQGLGVIPGQTVNHDGITAVLNPEFKLNDHVMFYALVGHGDKAPAINTSANFVNYGTAAQFTTPLYTKPTESMDYEVGAKTNWFDGQLVSNVNLYWNDLWNFQAASVTPYQNSLGNTAYISYLSNVPQVRIRGVELIERWAPPFIEGLTLHSSGSFEDARYVSYPNGPPPPQDGYAGGPASGNESGQRLQGVPRFTANAGADYQRPVGPVLRDLGLASKISSDWTNRSFTFFTYANVAWFGTTAITDALNNYQYWQHDYAIVNGGAGLKTDDGNYSFTLWVKNAANARPFTAFTQGSATTPAAVALTNQGPRYFGGTVLVSF